MICNVSKMLPIPRANSRRCLQKRRTIVQIRNYGTLNETTILIPVCERRIPGKPTGKKTTQSALLNSSEADFLDKEFDFDSELDAHQMTESGGISQYSCSSTVGTAPCNAADYSKICRLLKVVPSKKIISQLEASSSRLFLSRHHIGPTGIKALARTLLENACVRHLELHDCGIGNSGLEHILQMMQTNKFIETLVLSANKLQSNGANLLGKFLKTNLTLRVLDVSDNDFRDQDVRHFTEALKENATLKELRLSRCCLGECAGAVLEEAMSKNHSLTSLDLSWNHLRKRSAVAISRMLQLNSTLKSLNLAWNGFALEGSVEMAKSLRRNQTLTELNLSANRIDMTAINHMLSGLHKNKSLRFLKIGSNPITTVGATLILKAIFDMQTSGIHQLDLTNISVDGDFLTLLSEKQDKHPMHVVHGSSVLHDDVVKCTQASLLDTDDPLTVLFEYMKQKNFRLIDLFRSLDKDKSDSLSKKEFLDGLSMVGVHLSSRSLDKLVKILDLNKDREVSYEELYYGQKEHTKRISKAKKMSKSGFGLNNLESLRETVRLLIETSSKTRSK